MTQPLYLVPQLEFSKLAAETALPEDPNAWPDAVLQEAYKQVPYLADFDLDVTMETVDGERGYGLGHIEVTNKTEAPMTSPKEQMESAGIRTSRIPVIVKDSKLYPFDVLITDDSRAIPLTEGRLRQAMFRPQNFDVTSKTPGDQSMIGQLYPPYRQNYGFGGGGVAVGAGMGGKTAEAKTGSALESWLEKEALSVGAIGKAVQSTAAKGVRSAEDLGRFGERMHAKATMPGVAGQIKGKALVARNAVDKVTGTARATPRLATPASLDSVMPKAASADGLDLMLKVAAFEEAIATSKTGSILEAVLPYANVTDLMEFKRSLLDDDVKLAYAQNPATYDAIEKIGSANPITFEKQASTIVDNLKPSVVQVLRTDEGYAIKTASHHMWAPREERVDRGELVRRVGSKIALAADLSGGVTMGEGAGVTEEGTEAAPGTGAGPISAPGMYQVSSTSGEMLTGVVIPNLLDVDGTALPICLFTDGQHAAVQSDMSGVPVGEFTPPGTLPAEQASGHGCFFSAEGGIPIATLPVTLGATVQATPGSDESPHFQAETFDGRQIQVCIQPYVATVVGVDGTMIVPQGWQWLPLDSAAEIELAESPAEVGKVAGLRRKLATVQVRAGGFDCFSLSGIPVEKLASDEREFLTQAQALFVLVGLGAEPKYAQQKLASACSGASRVEDVRVGKQLKLASELLGESYTKAQDYLDSTPVFRHRMWKEAAALADPVAVDTVLSLGFINPENLATYVGYLPTLDEAQRRLCELLIGARLGMRELSEGSIERCIRALEDVIEGLKVIAFQG